MHTNKDPYDGEIPPSDAINAPPGYEGEPAPREPGEVVNQVYSSFIIGHDNGLTADGGQNFTPQVISNTSAVITADAGSNRAEISAIASTYMQPMTSSMSASTYAAASTTMATRSANSAASAHLQAYGHINGYTIRSGANNCIGVSCFTLRPIPTHITTGTTVSAMMDYEPLPEDTLPSQYPPQY